MSVLRAFDRILTKAVTWLLMFFFVMMLGIAALQVLLRLFLHTGIICGDIAARHLTRFLHPKLKAWFGAFSDLFAIVICYFMMQASLTFVEVGMDADSMLFLQVPQRAAAIIVPLGFGLMLIQFLLRMIENIVRGVRGPEAEGPAL